MATFSINQARHLYVANDADDINYVLSGDKKTLMFKYNSPGGVVGSDIIDVDKILYASKTTAAKMQPKFNTVSIKVTKAVVGQEYVIKVMLNNYAGAGDDNYTVKYGIYFAKTGDTANTIAAGLKDSLQANMKDLVKLPTVGGSNDTITITEVADDYEVGVKPFRIVKVAKKDISLFAINDGSVETTEWATISEASADNSSYTNGYLIADMEWFYVGARGDMYRGFGHPYGVKTKLVANTSTAYDTIDIHYAYVGPNEGAQKSEKTITIALPAGNTKVTTINDVLAELGVPGVKDSKPDAAVLPATAE